MAALLEQGVDFDCVICDNDEMALGVIEALEAAGWDPGAAPIVSVDHTAEGAAALESGKLYMTVDQNPEDQARAAVAAASIWPGVGPMTTGSGSCWGTTARTRSSPLYSGFLWRR